MSSENDRLAHNRARAAVHLAQFKDKTIHHLIDGKACSSEQTFAVLDPATNDVLGHAAKGGALEVDLAAKAAAAAFPAWRDVAPAWRRNILYQIASEIEARAEEIALVESTDTGQPIRYMEKAARRGAENFRFYADMALVAADGKSLPTPTHINYTTRQPIGPVGVITPWNTPFMLSTWKIAPAMAAGCTIVHKPAEWSPLSATLLANIIHSVIAKNDLPSGVNNLVHGIGEMAGKALTMHPAIKAIAFVGESATGAMIMAQGAATLKRVHFELGGKNPVIVFKDADFERALDATLFMIYSLNGQRCTSSSRALIHHSIYDQFTKALVERINNIKIGDPLDPATEIGPLIHPIHSEKVLSYFTHARTAGATIAAGGARAMAGMGNYIQPTLFTGADNAMQIAQEEIFGPVLTAIPFETEAEAIALANGVSYGLAGYIWTENVGRAHRVARLLEAGMVWVNSENVRHLPTPFGGTKASGIGRDGGEYAFDTYMEHKNIAISYGNADVPKIGTG